MGKRVDWTDYEQSQVYAATVDLLKSRKVPLPVPPPGKEFLQAIRDAQVSLPENRRRPMASIDSVTGDLAKRFVDNGVIRKDHQDSYRRGWDKKQRRQVEEVHEVDPRDAEIQDLKARLTSAEETLLQAEQHRIHIEAELEYWKNQPGPMDFIQQWVAQTLALALTRAEDAKRSPLSFQKPPEQKQHTYTGTGPDSFIERARREPIPQFERERRKDPTPTPGTGDLRPRFAVLADFSGNADAGVIHKGVSDVAQMRYLDSDRKLEGLQNFVGNGGKVIMWTDYAPHDWEGILSNRGVSFHRFRGGTQNLIEYIRQQATKRT